MADVPSCKLRITQNFEHPRPFLNNQIKDTSIDERGRERERERERESFKNAVLHAKMEQAQLLGFQGW